MFRPCINYIPALDFLKGVLGHEWTAMGDQRIATRPITVFVDMAPTEYQLSYNPYNILILLQPNEVTGLREWVLSNGNVFSCILTTDQSILDTYDTSIYFPAEPASDLYTRIKNFLLEIIESNEIPESTYWSQEMEDRWIVENLVLPEKGFFLDIGACHAKIISNTYYFEQHGWNGLGIDPDPVFFQDLKKYRKCFLEQVAISPIPGKTWCKPKGFGIVSEREQDSIEVECVRLDALLDKYNIKEIDLISIDIEGYEKIAWSTFDYTKYNPKVIITEHTEFGKFNTSFTEDILKNKNYYIAQATPLNYILVHKDVKRK